MRSNGRTTLRRLLSAALVAAALSPAAAHAVIPPRTDVRCVVTEGRTKCGYFASGPGRYYAARVGPWVVRIYREGRLVWSAGAHTPSEGWIPSVPGDRVEAAIGLNDNLCPSPREDVPIPPCRGGGAIIVSELDVGP